MSLDDPETKLMLAYLENRRIEHATEYARRGRRYESLSDERLQQEWLVQFRAWADYAELGERFDLTMFNDMEAEMSLRGREPPYELAKTEFDRVTAASRRATDELQRDPEASMDAGRDVEADLSAFRESLKNSKKN